MVAEARVQTSLRLPVDVAAKLEEETKKRQEKQPGYSQNQLIIEALQDYLGRGGSTEEE